jgi:hypothetical protein
LSGEDLYTVMAWHLQKHAASMEKQALKFLMLSPPNTVPAQASLSCTASANSDTGSTGGV